MAKNTPAWKTLGLAEPPPVVLGYHDYGTVYEADQGPQTESLRHLWDIATWSWAYWGKKVRRDIKAVRAEGGRGTLRGTALDQAALGLVWLAEQIHRPKQMTK